MLFVHSMTCYLDPCNATVLMCVCILPDINSLIGRLDGG